MGEQRGNVRVEDLFSGREECSFNPRVEHLMSSDVV